MKQISSWQTHDGLVHNSVNDAERHLEALYGNLLCKLARELGHLNYTERAQYINDNLNAFIQLATIKADQVIEENDHAK